MQQKNEESDYLFIPRKELSERAFRRYEVVIAEAQRKAIHIVDPEVIINGEATLIAPRTYAERLKDAMRGFQRFHYSSQVVQPGLDAKLFRILVGVDGKVYIRNLVKLERLAVEEQAQKETQEEEIEQDLKTYNPLAIYERLSEKGKIVAGKLNVSMHITPEELTQLTEQDKEELKLILQREGYKL